MDKNDYIWYACYGSNLSYDRFMCYIKGGTPEGSSKQHQGCSDKTPPQKFKKLIIRHELFFSGKSTSWGGGGVAFVDPAETQNLITCCKTYLITQQQFEDVFRQENDLSPGSQIDFSQIFNQKTSAVIENVWYPKIIFLGYKENFPVFTLTCNSSLLEPSKPSQEYLKTIIKGLKEIKLQNSAIINYLSAKKGIKEFYSAAEIQTLVEK
jgi:hypothetical protein